MTPLIDLESRLLLRTATRPDDVAVPAFRQWRAMVTLDDAGSQAHRVMPALVELVQRNGIEDPDIQRLQGARRHIWARNAVQMKDLSIALDALEADGLRPILLKGGALFARWPELASSRSSGDYDILMPPGRLKESVRSLERAGFYPVTASWKTVLEHRPTTAWSGAALARGGYSSKLDFHWRPLKIPTDPRVVDTVWAGREKRLWQSREVLVPSPAHHLFLSIARCDFNDIPENFQRLLEGHMLLSRIGPAGIDWREVSRLIGRYGLEAQASAYFAHLAEECATPLPWAIAARYAVKAGPLGALDSRFRAIPPDERTPRQRWFLALRDRTYGRGEPGLKTPGLSEAQWIAAPDTTPGRLAEIHKLMVPRHAGPPAGSRWYTEGWFYPEMDGRWTNGRLAGLVVPLTSEQRDGKPVTLTGHLMTNAEGSARLVANAGGPDVETAVRAPKIDVSLSLVVKPQRQLGGNGLIVFWLPDACAPRDKGEGTDSRRLGLFLRDG